ncbi:putative WD repeat-containing protein [Wickerhamomyces ciferrii]|uniref:WD repeat-containing protein n=1 Tax=Wickerhamomyces ciferrii (strain ATCC 14091 / BCRC 22168 / CBS 111 / JCM 3599 / NBRC 0793 / NRRL Y-1031 F-60-10) TaxID=1206466 RepID=K0KR09_WICCF|nr:putative WD repeat-containing protein [Wickerhamomyces ciferrii]CCH45561.1 putative WD repeat-containing protein [Wickerhamomyces ciferrii]
MSSNKQRVAVVKNPVLPAQTTPEQRYWRGYTNTQIVKEHNAVSHIAFNPISPHDFAITSSTRIQVFSSRTREVVKTFSRFKDTVYSGEYRFDGKLFVAGDASGLVQIFDALQPRTLLVSINPSTHPTHVTKFHPTLSTNLLTASDDRVARLYDISNSASPIISFDDHEDYIRTAGFIPGSNLITTGCYDGFVRIFDARVGSDPVAKYKQNSPVEDILPLTPTSMVTAGGPSIKIWDLAAGKLVNEMSNFQKTVTCLADAGDNRGILTGSLDGHVKVFDLVNWDVKFGWKFGGGVLSCGVSPNSKHFVAGLTSGLLSIRTRKTEPKVKQGVKQVKSNAFKKMLRGAEYQGEEEHRIISDKPKQSKKLKQYERYLNAFRWSEALDAAFIPGVSKEITVTVLEELKKRGKVRASLSGRDETSLEPILTWSLKAIEDVRSVNIVADWVAVIIELYGGMIDKAPVLEELILTLRKKISQEVEKAREAQKIEGMLQLLTAN